MLVKTPYGPVKVDVIEIGRWETDPAPEDPNDALYALAHAWAIDSSTAVRIVVDDEGDGTSVDVAVATPGNEDLR